MYVFLLLDCVRLTETGPSRQVSVKPCDSVLMNTISSGRVQGQSPSRIAWQSSARPQEVKRGGGTNQASLDSLASIICERIGILPILVSVC